MGETSFMNNRPLLLAIAAIALVFYLAWPSANATLPGSAEPETGNDSQANQGDPARGALRSEIPTEPEDAPVPAEPIDPAVLHTVRGRVFDITGKPLPGVPVRHGDTVLGESDGVGAFAVEIEVEGRTTLVAEGNGYAPLLNGVVAPHNRQREHVLVAGLAIDLAGMVVDPDGTALSNARVDLYLNDAVLRDFPHGVDMTTPVQHVVVSAEDGRFDLGTVAAVPRRFVSARMEGYGLTRTPAPEYTRQDLYLVLTPQEGAPEPTIDGFVLLPDGRPAGAATVQLGHDGVLTNDNGAFSLALPGPEPGMVLVAGLKDYGTAVMSDFEMVLAATAPNPPAPITLVLREQPLNISGQVVDARGTPMAGWIVNIQQGTAVTRNMTPPVLVEGFGTGLRNLRQVTGNDGAFVLADLMDREYRIRIHQRRTLLTVITDPIPAGTEDARILIEDGLVHEVVRGLVLSHRGLPQPGVKVTLGLVTHRLDNSQGSSWQSGNSTIADADGRFQLHDVPRRYVHLDIAGETVIPTRFEFSPDSNASDLRITVPARRHLRVNVTGGDVERLYMEVHDAEGQGLSIYTFSAGGFSSTSSQRIDQGQTRVLSVSEQGVFLLIFRDQEVVARREILLDPDRVTELTVELR
jgi:protocatechuate 3,4-dioxygenase beta subunit